MHPSPAFSALALMAVASNVIAKTIIINAGENGLSYTPNSVTADVGDTIEFHFFNNFHTAVQGDFNTPCSRGSLAGSGFNSGPINNKPDGSGSVFQVQVTNDSPMWFYCSTPTHCQSGMAGVINPPSSGNTLSAYMSAAAGTSSSEGSSTVQGGVVVPVPSSGGSSSEAPTSSSPPASSPPASTPPVSSTPPTSSTAPAPSSSSESETETYPSTTSSKGSPSGSSASVVVSPTASVTANSTTSSAPKTTSSLAVTSGAAIPKSFGLAAQSTLISLAVGVGLLAFFMA